MKIDKIIEKNKSREFISQFIYHGHGRVYERLAKKKKEKRCEGCESDIDAIIDFIKFNMVITTENTIKEFKKVIRKKIHELENIQNGVYGNKKDLIIPAKISILNEILNNKWEKKQ
jgi:hypothetical protein